MGFQVYLHLSCIILVVAVRVVDVSGAGGEECRMTRCSHHGPEIRFPFWIKEKQQPEYCGYPGFQVFCDGGKTLMHLQYLANTSLTDTLFFLSKNVSIYSINYASQEVELYVLDGSQFTNNLKLFSASSTSLPSTPYFENHYPFDYGTICFSCSAGVKSRTPDMLTSLEGKTLPVYCLEDTHYSAFSGEKSLSSCTKIFSSRLPAPFLSQRRRYHYFPAGVVDALSISWLAPNCSKCEAKGEYCRRKSNASSNIEAADYSTICFPKGPAVRFSIKPITFITPVKSTSETYFPEWIFQRLEEGGEVTIQIEKEDDSNIARRLTIVGLWCIGWHPVDRPSMKHVINMLESEECPKMPPNPFRSSNVRSFTNDLEVISEFE
ncbi:hypothetical protein ACET3Z_008089 [Daucus carota]